MPHAPCARHAARGARGGAAARAHATHRACVVCAQVQAEHVSGLTALLAFNAGSAASLKDVLKNRDQSQLQYNKAIALLDSRSKERQKWQTANANAPPRSPVAASSGDDAPKGMMSSLMAKVNTLVDDPQKGTRLQQRVTEAEQALGECKSKWETISGSVAQEAAAFHAMTNADFSRGLIEHVQRQLSFEDEKQRTWRQLLHEFEQVDAGGGVE